MIRMILMKFSRHGDPSRQDDVAITHLNFSPEYEKANGIKWIRNQDSDLFGSFWWLKSQQQQSNSNLSKFGIAGRVARCTNRTLL